MINFLIESNVSLVALLAFYHLFLEREKMHQFNRFYLLISLVISLIIPFIKIELIKEVETVFIPLNSKEPINKDAIIPENETVNYFPILLLSLYVIVVLILFARFLKNIYSFKKTIKNNEKVSYKNAILVLIDKKIIPHTFLNYILLNKESYEKNTIEKELYLHELTHVNQKHTYDILGIELLKIIFWFNPIFYFYKKAIQLNHEFIADENVVKTHSNVPFYQSLLLHTNENTNYYLASNLNYLITKKRLIMMTKTTSKSKILLKKISILPIFVLMLFISCTKSSDKKNEAKNIEFYINGIKVQKYEMNKSIEEFINDHNINEKKGNKKTMENSLEVVEIGVEANMSEPIFPYPKSFNDYIISNYNDSSIDFKNKNLEARFVVKKDGTIGNIRLLNVKKKSIENEIINIIKNSPKWKPGIVDGEIVQFQKNIKLF